jgi:hypothetical protein
MKARATPSLRSTASVNAGTPAPNTPLGRVAAARKRADFAEAMAGPLTRFRRSRKLR